MIAVGLESYIRQEWDNILLPNIQQLVSSFSRCLQTVVKRREDITNGEHVLVPTFLTCVAAIKFNIS